MRAAGSLLLLTLLCATALGDAALAQGGSRYVTDEMSLLLRDSPSASGSSRGVVTSGTRVQVLETDEASGYAKIRTSDGREGWILQRYLRNDPIAREKLLRVEKELAATQAELKKVREDHARLLEDFSRISGGQPIASREVIEESQRLKEQLKQNDAEVAAIRARYDEQREARNTLLLGGGLVAGGVLLALILRWLWPGKRRGYL